MMGKFTIQLSLKTRVYLVNAILLSITVIGAVLMIWYTYKTEKIFKDIIEKSLVIYQSAEAIDTSLVNQKGYYLLDYDPAWIDQFSRYRLLFNEHLVMVKSLAKEQEAIKMSRIESHQLRYIALLAMIIVIVLSLLINYIFSHHILKPIQKLATEADMLGSSNSPTNEVAALKLSVQGLIENAEQTHQDLKQSRETLMQSKKMALLGKLAAGTSHSIRNPLTSVKMRLFSLNRSCDFTKPQQEDFNVISGEIKQINKIVENFLEFARPPKLKMKKISPSSVVDSALHLLEHRLKSYHVTTRLIRHYPLNDTFIDPEQLKEVMVNIIINACEAMDKGGLIVIHEEETFVEPLKKVAVIRIIDDGTGIDQKIKDQIFNPFFTTKDEGTGLGLSIAFNIINEHGGWLDVSSQSGRGASFIITLPIKDS